MTSPYLDRKPREIYGALSMCVVAAVKRGDADRVSFLNSLWETELKNRVDSTDKRACAKAARKLCGLDW